MIFGITNAVAQKHVGYHFARMAGVEDRVNKEQVGIIRYVVILCAIGMLGGVAMELAGKPAPSWLTGAVVSLITYLAGVATPQRLSGDDRKKNDE